MNNSLDFTLYEAYFESIKFVHFPELFQKNEPVFAALDKILPSIQNLLNHYPSDRELPVELDYWERPSLGGGIEKVLTVREGVLIDQDMAFPSIGVFLSQGVILEPTAILKAPLYVGKNTEIRQGAYIRGNVIIGDNCTIGHNTEVKSSIFMGHSEAGHFAYVGDSILGHCVNLGAGTKLANLAFRTLSQKKNQEFPSLKPRINGNKVDLSRSKLGAILGDGVETGCNSVLSPGCFIGIDSWIYPCQYVPSGYYPPGSIIKSTSELYVREKI